MEVISNWSPGAVFWRTFDKNDTVYLFGLRQGTVSNGGTLSYNNPKGFFQMELKRGDIWGPTIIAAGQVFSNDDEFVLNDDKTLVAVEDAVTVVVGDSQVEDAGHVVQFFTAAGADSTLSISSKIVQTIDQSGQSTSTISSEASDENGASVGAKETVGGGKMPVGLELSQGASNKVSSKISKVVESKVNMSVSTQSTYDEDQQITLKAHKLTALYSSWQRQFVVGSANLVKTHLTFSATLRYVGSRQITEYDSPDQLPPELMAAYRAQNPGYHPPLTLHDGAVLREQSSAPVYVIFGQAKFHVPDPPTLFRLYGGWANVTLVPDGALDAVPTTPVDGTILREENHPEVWRIAGGQKCHITTEVVLGRYGGWGVVHVVPDSATAQYPEGEPIT